MRAVLFVLGFFGFALLARGMDAFLELESENRIGIETMTAVEIGLGALIMVAVGGFIALLGALDRSAPRSPGSKVSPKPTPDVVRGSVPDVVRGSVPETIAHPG